MMSKPYFHPYSSLSRPIDPRYPTNAAILVLSTVIGAVVFVLQLLDDASLVDAVIHGVVISAVTFFTWVISRELDPPHDYSAFVAVGLLLVGFATIGTEVALIALVAMPFLRVVNQVVGTPMTLWDTLGLFGAAAFAGLTEYWLIGMFGALAILLEPRALHPRSLVAALIAVVTLVAAAVTDNLAVPDIDNRLTSLLMAGGVVALFWVTAWSISRQPVTLKTDRTDELVNPRAIFNTQLLAGAMVLGLVAWLGEDALEGLLPYWAAMLATILWQIWVRLRG